jgi:hypothetical protein
MSTDDALNGSINPRYPDPDSQFSLFKNITNFILSLDILTMIDFC